MEFYKTVIKNALIIFLIVVLFTSIVMLLHKDQYPVIVNPCPDHWVYEDNNKTCNNVHNIGRRSQIKLGRHTYSCKTEGVSSNPIVNGKKPFSHPWWNWRNGVRKKVWARRCKQPWTGVWPSAYGNNALRGNQYNPYNPFKRNRNIVTTVNTDKI